MEGSPRFFDRHGFTLVELLVVIAIIGVLIVLLLLGVVQACGGRWCARHNCRTTSNRSPWAFSSTRMPRAAPLGRVDPLMIGRPDRGFGKRQPGAWTSLLILPFVEQQALHDLGHELTVARQRRPMRSASPCPWGCTTVAPTCRPVLYPVGPSMNWGNANWGSASLYLVPTGAAAPATFATRFPPLPAAITAQCRRYVPGAVLGERSPLLSARRRCCPPIRGPPTAPAQSVPLRASVFCEARSK